MEEMKRHVFFAHIYLLHYIQKKKRLTQSAGEENGTIKENMVKENIKVKNPSEMRENYSHGHARLVKVLISFVYKYSSYLHILCTP